MNSSILVIRIRMLYTNTTSKSVFFTVLRALDDFCTIVIAGFFVLFLASMNRYIHTRGFIEIILLPLPGGLMIMMTLIRTSYKIMLHDQRVQARVRIRVRVCIQGLEALDHLLLKWVKLRPQSRIVVEGERVLEALELHMELKSFEG
ncbi:hypothetical protein PanWU01x14_184470 [Parasponia andersonii]|uniref:Uncharacterized protein n=1 Tax=Parasponia andersonii TaxID=3476 RepID=A0A2P5C4G3_PARAD|nr:hypothetical protein PanWU01x14_184470 [Parasponia andersonii]